MRQARINYRADHGCYYCTIRGRQYQLGRDYDAADFRFRQLIQQHGVLEGKALPPRTVATLIERWQRVHVSRFQSEMTRPFAQHIGAMALEFIPTSVLDTYKRSLIDRGLAPETIAKYVRYAHAVLRWGHDQDFVAAVPRPHVPTPRRNPRPRTSPAGYGACGSATAPGLSPRQATIVNRGGLRDTIAHVM